MKPFLLAVILLFSLAATAQGARLDTSFSFATIETPHFSFHYHQGLELAARRVAGMAEEIHTRLTREFLWEPAEKTEVVLIDDSDFANGYSLSIPYNTIFLQIVPPSLLSTIGEYDDWLKILFTHEYTHIVTGDAARGYSKLTRAIFGKPLPGGDPLSELLFIVASPPNVFMPHWWHEGMAVWAETEFSRAGRGRGSFFDMVYRMAVAENNIPSIDRVNGELPDWPNGSLPYIYGYRLQKYIADTYGKEALGTLSLAQAGRFPYFINQPPRRLAGKDFEGLYRDMVLDLRQEQRGRIQLLSQTPFTPLDEIYRDGENLTFPRVSPDGSRIAFNRHDPNDHATVLVTSRDGSKVITRFRRQYSDDGSISFSPDGATIYFDQAEIENGFDVYQDLYSFDLESQKITRLTHGARLREVDLSPDGTTFAAVVSHRGSQNLALLDRGARSVSPPRPVTGYSLERVSSPRWSPDSRTIAFVVTDNQGVSGVHLFDVEKGTDREIFAAGHTLAFPTWSRDGSFLLYTSDETGVFNLFAYALKEGKSHQVTHLLGGAMQPEITPDGQSVLFSSYRSHGFKIAQAPLDKNLWIKAPGPSLPPRREVSPKVEPITSEPAMNGPASKPYAPWKTLYPHFWLPRITSDGSGAGVYGLFTAGQDVLGYNTYLLTVDYGPGRNRPYFDLTYQNDYLYPTITLKGYAQPVLYGSLLQRGDFWELDQSASAELSVPINFLESAYRIRGGYQLLDRRALTALDANGEFDGLRISLGRRDSLFVGVDFADNLKYPYSISSEEGSLVSLFYRRFQRGMGSDITLSELSLSLSEFFSLPTARLKHHVIYLNLVGALSAGDRDVQEAFQLGGPPSDLNLYSLRGYPSRSSLGKYLAKGTLEYRFPIIYPMVGPGTRPFFLEKFHAAFFADAGEVWDEQNKFGTERAKVGAGAEVRWDFSLGYWLKVTPALGFAHGFVNGGENQIYFTLYADL